MNKRTLSLLLLASGLAADPALADTVRDFGPLSVGCLSAPESVQNDYTERKY